MPDIYDVARGFREELQKRDAQAAAEMVRYYGAAWSQISRELAAVLKEIERALGAGATPKDALLAQRRRLEALQSQVETEIGRFASFAGPRIDRATRATVKLAIEHAKGLAAAGLGTPPPGVIFEGYWRGVPTGAVEQMVGQLQVGSALSDALRGLGKIGADHLRQELVTGVVMGRSSREIARRIRGDLGGTLSKALTWSRTERFRAYREATRRAYQEHPDVIEGWIWLSARNHRTCPACLAMHGSFHTLDERLDGHPCCRCTMVPHTKSWDEVLGRKARGVGDTRPSIEEGEEWFAKQPATLKQKVLGPAAYKQYAAGRVKLGDFVGRRTNPRWGTMRYTRSLSDALSGRARTPAAPRLKVVAASAGGGGGRSSMRVPHIGVNESWGRGVDQRQKQEIPQLAAKHGMTPAQYKRAVLKHVKDLVGRAGLYTRRPVDDFEKIVDDGRWKTQFEIRSTQGFYGPPLRAQVEEQLFGFPITGGDVTKRPVYGYLAEGGFTTDNGEEEQYGAAVIRMKASTRDRTTFSFWDSLDIPMLVGNPEYGSFWMGPSPLSRPNTRAAHMNAAYDHDPLNINSVNELEWYAEAQLHGGVTIDDIDEVIFVPLVPSDEPTDTLKAKLDRLGIPWRIVRP